MSNVPYRQNYASTHLGNRHHGMDQTAAFSAKSHVGVTRPPLGERPVGINSMNMNVDHQGKTCGGLVKPAPPQSFHRQYNTPNHRQATSVSDPNHSNQTGSIPPMSSSRESQLTTTTTPFKSPISLCFERMLGAGM